MTPQTLEEQLTKYLADAHSIEAQALPQMKAAPKLAGDPALSEAFADHLPETEEHERLVRERLEARGGQPVKLKDLAGTLTGQGFVAFAASQPDTPGKLIVHAYAYEHMEEAAYALLSLLAERVPDAETLEVANRICRQEQDMAARLEGLFDQAVGASLQAKEADDPGEELDKYLADAHALEQQSIQLLSKGPDLAGAGELATAYQEHLAETEEHSRLLEERLEARGAKPSRLKDAALRVGALNWGAFFAAQPDTPAKLCGFAYAVEHLEIGGYELLRRVADRAGDGETAQVAQRILREERGAAEKLRSLFPQALDAALRDQRLPAR